MIKKIHCNFIRIVFTNIRPDRLSEIVSRLGAENAGKRYHNLFGLPCLLTHVTTVVEVQRGQGQRQEKGGQEHSAGYDGQVAFQVRPPLPPCRIPETEQGLRENTGKKQR